MRKIILFLSIFVCGFALNAEILTLSDGQVIRGKIIKMNEDSLTVITDFGEMYIDRSKINKTYFNENEYEEDLKAANEKPRVEIQEKIVIQEKIIEVKEEGRLNFFNLTDKQSDFYSKVFEIKFGILPTLDSINSPDKKMLMKKEIGMYNAIGGTLLGIGGVTLGYTVVSLLSGYVFTLLATTDSLIDDDSSNFNTNFNLGLILLGSSAISLVVALPLMISGGVNVGKAGKIKTIYRKLTGTKFSFLENTVPVFALTNEKVVFGWSISL